MRGAGATAIPGDNARAYTSPVNELLQVHGHDDVLEVGAAFEEAGAIGGRELQGNVVAIDDFEGIDEERGIEADFQICSFVLAGESDGRFTGAGRLAGDDQAFLGELKAHAFG